uniref:Uncharacterized protein n=1 Tax=Romanomermis culicivorax TaxID=13658 RepID=A0A915J9F3_ROMCU
MIYQNLMKIPDSLSSFLIWENRNRKIDNNLLIYIFQSKKTYISKQIEDIIVYCKFEASIKQCLLPLFIYQRFRIAEMKNDLIYI